MRQLAVNVRQNAEVLVPFFASRVSKNKLLSVLVLNRALGMGTVFDATDSMEVDTSEGQDVQNSIVRALFLVIKEEGYLSKKTTAIAPELVKEVLKEDGEQKV